ncbi:DUF3054 domain-containing protein [Intrasporangium sp. YIM S08009]|uniref:DUF3054 domain-containing protein n=1 Tax=Intrasporangium zincisolvens TaxID=3080018 RepID=UPI002B058CE3|nr:DUF3054 domain-containing protein [Intrasporangium sp. YIM S08009]
MNRPVSAVLRRPVVAALLDVVLVVVFAAVGRASHAESNPVAGALATAWPFLVGTLVGWVVVRVLRGRWPVDVGPGVTVWFSTVLFGMLLRHLTGAGTAASFVVVASVVLAVFLLGWRGLAALLARRHATSPA